MPNPNPTPDHVQKNFDVFVLRLPELMKTHAGKYALMRDEETVEFFDTAPDAYAAGMKLYEDRRFSIQEVTDEPIDLGIFSHFPYAVS